MVVTRFVNTQPGVGYTPVYHTPCTRSSSTKHTRRLERAAGQRGVVFCRKTCATTRSASTRSRELGVSTQIRRNTSPFRHPPGFPAGGCRDQQEDGDKPRYHNYDCLSATGAVLAKLVNTAEDGCHLRRGLGRTPQLGPPQSHALYRAPMVGFYPPPHSELCQPAYRISRKCRAARSGIRQVHDNGGWLTTTDSFAQALASQQFARGLRKSQHPPGIRLCRGSIHGLPWPGAYVRLGLELTAPCSPSRRGAWVGFHASNGRSTCTGLCVG